jgi:hypothetical protein
MGAARWTLGATLALSRPANSTSYEWDRDPERQESYSFSFDGGSRQETVQSLIALLETLRGQAPEPGK